MNLMFRKNFQGGTSSKSGGGPKLNKMNRAGKRSRDMSSSGPSSPEDCYFRTHIFFNANRGGFQNDNEGYFTNFFIYF